MEYRRVIFRSTKDSINIIIEAVANMANTTEAEKMKTASDKFLV